MTIKSRLILMEFLQFAVMGAYLISMGSYLISVGLSAYIGLFYSLQGIVSLFMPALICMVADRWIPAQKMLGICHIFTALFFILASLYGSASGGDVKFGTLFTLYGVGVAFFSPTISLSNSVAFSALEGAGMDSVKHFPAIRLFGTVGFICAMLLTDIMGIQTNPNQFAFSGVLATALAAYSFSLPACKVNAGGNKSSLAEIWGVKALSLFKRRNMAMFFIFSILLGVSLQITDGFANPFITGFGAMPQFADTFGVNHANMLISLSQTSEVLCMLLVPFFMRRYGIKKVMLISMLAWVARFALFGAGNPGTGVWMFILSMAVYGVAFNFFIVSGALFVDANTDRSMRSSAQGLLAMMTNGIGSIMGMLGAQAVLNRLVFSHDSATEQMAGWSATWYVFAAYALAVAVAFALLFKYKHVPAGTKS